ncbi:MAG TPA: hypothetical protein VFZ58_00760 [Candidatus Saccharimonadales bacterium]
MTIESQPFGVRWERFKKSYRPISHRGRQEMGRAGLWSMADWQASTEAAQTLKGKQLMYTTYFDGDPRYQSLTGQVVQGRTERYFAKGIWKTKSVNDPVRSNGNKVEFVVLTEPYDSVRPIASLRKVHSIDASGASALPSYRRFSRAQTFAPEAKLQLDNLALEHEAVEIAALYSEEDADTTFALYGLALRDSIVRGEVWFMGVVPHLYKQLHQNFGDRVVQTMGEATLVNDGIAEDSLALHPVLVEPTKLPAALLEDIYEATAKSDQRTAQRRTFVLLNIIKQFDFNWERHFGTEVASRLKELSNESH